MRNTSVSLGVPKAPSENDGALLARDCIERIFFSDRDHAFQIDYKIELFELVTIRKQKIHY